MISSELPPLDQLLAQATLPRAWQIDRSLRLHAIPLDRRVHAGAWDEQMAGFPAGDNLIRLFWRAAVPGSGAPEIPYAEMAQAMYNQGYDVRAAEALLPRGITLAQAGEADDLRALTTEFLSALHAAPKIVDHPYWRFEHPGPDWAEIEAALGDIRREPEPVPQNDLYDRTLAGWLCQLAGGAFGTALEGYHSTQLARVYGPLDFYVAPPETMNDDVVYELVLLDALERYGPGLTSARLAVEWVRQIPFGWSAEWAALRNLGMGILPPASGSFRNPYSDWIGAQMRGMVCGMLAPGRPLAAARLAHLDGIISHSRNGVYGEMFAAAITALAYVRGDVRGLIAEALAYVPQRSEYRAVAGEILAILAEEAEPGPAWQRLDMRFQTYNWIHAYPNLAADLFALWYGGDDLTAAFGLLAHAGLDVDCNAGLVGTVLGVMFGAPARWTDPLGDRLDTYLPATPRLSIRELAARTTALAKKIPIPV
ncbi:MAG: ADP-ribosylglycohydrolase family protein [Caldilineaceae bacterium]|nr:ADP-ribosylglycohydrolase family protein [Caldilineaceae bacterium]